MDANSNQAPGLDLPQSVGPNDPIVGVTTAGQGVPAVDPAAVAAPQVIAEGDMELLDQDWVNKAKDIVEKTKGDPFTESNELSKIKAGYLKVRYNKDINVSEP